MPTPTRPRPAPRTPSKRTAVPDPAALKHSPDEHRQAARDAGLRYVDDARPGIARKPAGKSFVYVTARGKTVRDAATLDRIRKLAIPPAYRDVWVSPDPAGHIQAVGRDARGRKQYRYHPKWREARDEEKYGRMIAFARALPGIRAATRRHLARPGLPREKVLAAVVRIMEQTLIRVGNDEYAKANHSYGLTTLRDRHATVRGRAVRFAFTGKSGVRHEIDLADPRLAAVVKNCQDLPGQELFQYVGDAGRVRDVGSSDVNDYLREITGRPFTAKDFRTWAGTVLAARALREFEAVDSDAQAKRNVMAAIETVARKLGNTTAVCRKCYVHPEVLAAYLDGGLRDTLRRRTATMARSLSKLKPEEASVLTLLQRRLAGRKR